jgi:DNA anti-recombination protein RmuC
MDLLPLVVVLVVGLALGLLAGMAMGQSKSAARTAQAEARTAAAESRATSAETRAAAIEERAVAAEKRAATAEARAEAAEEKAAFVDERLAERFQALSTQVLDANSKRLLELAEGRFKEAGAQATGDLEHRKQAVEHLVKPVRETLANLETRLREFEIGRRSSDADLARQTEQLRRETQSLVRALQRPEARGRWGELQLRRVVEIAGMTRYCDFDEQASAQTPDGLVRPDMVVRLTGGKNIIVDSKVSLAAYLEAAESTSAEVRTTRLNAHARHLRDHVDKLAGKSYWQKFSTTPEFVVLFIPGESFLAPALDRDPGLLEHALGKRVHIATPTTLITLLRTVHYAWQQAALSENAKAVFELGKQLYDRLGTMGQHVDGLGRALTSAVKTYNKTVASLESRVLVSARKLNDLGVVDEELVSPAPVEETTRPVAAAEVLDVVPRPIHMLTAERDRGRERERERDRDRANGRGTGGRGAADGEVDERGDHALIGRDGSVGFDDADEDRATGT